MREHLVGDVLELQRDLVGVERLHAVEARRPNELSDLDGGSGPGLQGWATGPDRVRVRVRSRTRLLRALLLRDVGTDEEQRVGRDRRALLVLRGPEADVAPGGLVVASREGERVRLPDHRQVEDARVEDGAVTQARHVRVLRVQPPQRAE